MSNHSTLPRATTYTVFQVGQPRPILSGVALESAAYHYAQFPGARVSRDDGEPLTALEWSRLTANTAA